jgi:general secretion pathway protein D
VNSLRSLILAAALCTGLNLAAQVTDSAPAAEDTAIGQLRFVVPNPDERVEQLILRDESAEQVLSLLERMTGRIVLRPQGGVAGQITINASQALTKLEAVTALETLLAMNGIGLSPLGDRFLKVVPIAQVRSESPELFTTPVSALPASGRVVARLFTLSFLRVNEIQTQVVPLLNPVAAQVVPLERANSIIILDSIANLQRVEALLDRIDRPAAITLSTKFHIMRFARASEIANRLRTLAGGPLQGQLSAGTVIDADDRTNQVIVTTDARQHAIFDDLIARFDVQAEPNTRNELIPLKNADAAEVAQLLQQLVTGQNRSATERPATAQNQGNRGADAALAMEAAAAANAINDFSSGGENAQFSRLLTILPDTRSNSLVVSGTIDDIRMIRSLIEQIDTVLPQVRIEVVIASVTFSDEYRTGLQAVGLTYGQTAPGPDRWQQVGGGFNDLGNIVGQTGIPGLIFSGNIQDRTLAVAVQSLPGPSRAQLLATPVIVTSHNKEARFFAGESRPIVSQFTNGSTGTTGSVPSGNVTFRDAGIDITVKPLIGADGSIQLEINQKFDAFGPDVVIAGIGNQPSVNRRETQSFVTVSDGNVIVLSGLQREDRSNSRSRWGPIPILSDLLGGRNSSKNTSELLVFLRPTIIRDLSKTTEQSIKSIDQISEPRARETLQRQIGGPDAVPEKVAPVERTRPTRTGRPGSGPR